MPSMAMLRSEKVATSASLRDSCVASPNDINCEAGDQIAAVDCGDVPRTQRLQRAQVVPIKKMAFETLQPTQGLKRTEVALHQIVDGDVTEIIRRNGRQHG